MAHIHRVYDTDGHFIIDGDTRQLKNASQARVNLVQYDHNSERVTFELERYVDGHDMSLCNRVEIYYINKGPTGTSEGKYLVSDLQVSPGDENVVIFSWLISQHCVLHEGPLNFGVRFICTTDGIIDYAWNTAVYAGLVVAKGIGNSGADEVWVYDSLQAWIDAADDRVAAAEAHKEAASLAAIGARSAMITAQQAAQKAENAPLLLMTGTATADASLTVQDAAQGGALMELSMYGRTTQPGTPTASAPVPLFSSGAGSNVSLTLTADVLAHTVTVDTPVGLRGIPVQHGGNYTDEAGQRWVCDEIDLVRGVYIKRVDTVSGSVMTWYANGSRWQCTVSNPAAEALGSKDYYPILCNVATYATTGAADTCRPGNQGNAGMMLVYAPQDHDMSGVEVLYQCEPVETPLTEEQIAAAQAMRTSKTPVTVTTTAGGVRISYIKDVHGYIDEAMAEATRNTIRNPETAGTAGQVLCLQPDGSTAWMDVSTEGGGAVAASIDDDIPLVFLTGTLPTTKDDVVMGFELISRSQRVAGVCEIKCQGTSSMAYPKKNFTIKAYTDTTLEDKIKFNFRGWGAQQKFCYKANWIDITHARNIVSARLWGDVVRSRANYSTMPEELRTAPNMGAVDGFFAKVYANGVYQGRYTINIPKDKWMANMDDELETHCILCGENYGSGCFRAAALIDGTDWSDEVHDEVPASILARWNECIRFVRESSDTEFQERIGEYFDLESLIDYDIFALVSCGLDSMGKNQLYMTYDGQKWYASMYDLDSTWGLYHNGGSVVPAKYGRYQYEDYVNGREGNLLYARLEALFADQIQARYQELKAGALSMGNIISRFEHFMGACPADLVAEDYASTTANGAFVNIPSKSLTSLQHIRNFVAARYPYCDEYFGLMGSGTVPATGVTLNVTSLSIAPGETGKLVATPTPSNTTDPVVWLSSDGTVATVADGVVTAVSGGSCYIYAKCGDHMATCYVQIGSTITDEFGVVAYKTAGPLTFDGTTLPIDSGWAPYDKEGKDWTVAIKYKADLSHLTSGAQKTLVHTETPHSSGTNLTLWLFTYHETWQPDELNYCVTSGSYEFHNWGHGLTLSDDGYHYAVIAKEGNMVYHYMDGNLIAGQGFERVFPGTAGAHLYIGGIAGQAGLVGEISEVRIYDEYLSQADVTALTLTMKGT